MTTKGQITIPVEIRRQLGLRPGSILDFEVRRGQLVGQKADPMAGLDAVTGLLAHRGIRTDRYLDEVRGKARP